MRGIRITAFILRARTKAGDMLQKMNNRNHGFIGKQGKIIIKDILKVEETKLFYIAAAGKIKELYKS